MLKGNSPHSASRDRYYMYEYNENCNWWTIRPGQCENKHFSYFIFILIHLIYTLRVSTSSYIYDQAQRQLINSLIEVVVCCFFFSACCFVHAMMVVIRLSWWNPHFWLGINTQLVRWCFDDAQNWMRNNRESFVFPSIVDVLAHRAGTEAFLDETRRRKDDDNQG